MSKIPPFPIEPWQTGGRSDSQTPTTGAWGEQATPNPEELAKWTQP